MIRLAIFAVLLILAASYFGISLRSIAESPAGQDNFSFAWSQVQGVWAMLMERAQDAVGQGREGV